MPPAKEARRSARGEASIPGRSVPPEGEALMSRMNVVRVRPTGLGKRVSVTRRMRGWARWVLAAAAPLVVGVCHAAPPNDDCVDALPLTDPVTTFCTIGATTDGPPLPVACDEGTGLTFVADIWYSFAAPSSGTVCISTCGVADFDTRLAVYKGSCSALTLVACSDDAPGCGVQSRTLFTAAAGQQFLVRVGGHGAEGCGSLVVSALTCATCPPSSHSCFTVGGPGCADTDCCLAVCAVSPFCCTAAWDTLCIVQADELTACSDSQYACPGASAPVPNDCAPECLPLNELAVVTFDTTGATTDGPPTDCAYIRDIWYCITAPSTGQLEVTVSDATFDPVVALYDVGSSMSFDPDQLPAYLLQCGDARHDGTESIFLASSTVGEVYLIQVAGSLTPGSAQAGTGILTVRFEVPLVNSGPTVPALYDPASQGNFALTNVGFFTGVSVPGASGPTLFAQAFSLADSGSNEDWSIDEIHVAGCIPGMPGCVGACAPGGPDCPPSFVLNDSIVVTIWERDGLTAPEDGDQVTTIVQPFPTPNELADTSVQDEDLFLALDPPMLLPPGDYWFTAYATGATGGAPAGFVWLTNATGDVIPVTNAAGPAVYRSASFPATDFELYALNPSLQLASASGDDPLKLYSQGMRMLGDLGELSVCDRIRTKVEGAGTLLERVLEKKAELGVGNQGQLQQLAQQMYQQSAEARGLLEGAKAQLGGLGVGDARGKPCPEIDVQGATKNASQASDALEWLLATLAEMIDDTDVSTEELEVYLKELDGHLDGAVIQIQLAAQNASPCPADITGDGTVNGADLAEILARWGQPGTGDFDEDGGVDGGDLTVVLGAWGPCPS